MAGGMSLLEVRDLTLLRGGRTVVDSVSFVLGRGDVVAVMGKSGTGKSTLLRGIAGLHPIGGGEVHIDGLSFDAHTRWRAAARRDFYRRLGCVFQFHHLFAHLTALQNVALAPVHALGQPRVAAERTARVWLERLGVDHRADAYAHELSGGEAQRVAIARTLAVDPVVVLMDEPTAALDAERRGELAATFRDLATAGRALLVATHDLDFAQRLAGRTIVLDQGRIVSAAGVGEVF